MKVKISVARKRKAEENEPRYVRRVSDQGETANGFCPRCPALWGGAEQTALTKDAADYVYCLACGWMPGWTDSGLALTATV